MKFSAARLIPLALLCLAATAGAQMPFITDDADVTAPGHFHFEAFNELDWLQAQAAPHLRQNTINGKANYGLGHGLELDLDAPLIRLDNDNTTTPRHPFGIGDTDFGVKWNFREGASDSAGAKGPSLSTVLYVEVPTGKTSTGIGSGLTDTWLYGVFEQDLGAKTQLHANVGYLATGNLATGVIGITARGHVATMSTSLTRQCTEKVNLGAELAGAVTDSRASDHAQLQAMLGGSYAISDGVAVAFGAIAGHYAASPRMGFQIGFSLDQ